MTVGDLDGQGDAPIGAALGFKGGAQPGAPGRRGQPGAARASRVATQGTHIFQQLLRRGVGQRQRFLIHDRIGKAILDQQIAEVVHVHEAGRGGVESGVRQGLPQFAQRAGPQTGEHRQTAHAQDAAPFGQRSVWRGVPVQGEVGPHHVQGLRRQAGGGQVGIDETRRGRTPAGQPSDQGGQARRGETLAGLRQQGFAMIQPDVGGLRIAFAQ